MFLPFVRKKLRDIFKKPSTIQRTFLCRFLSIGEEKMSPLSKKRGHHDLRILRFERTASTAGVRTRSNLGIIPSPFHLAYSPMSFYEEWYLPMSISDKSDYQYWTQENVKQLLKAPKSADFGVSTVVAPAYLLYRWLSPAWSFFTFGMAEIFCAGRCGTDKCGVKCLAFLCAGAQLKRTAPVFFGGGPFNISGDSLWPAGEKDNKRPLGLREKHTAAQGLARPP